MRIARFTTGDEPRYAIVDGDEGAEELIVLSGDPMYTPGTLTGERIPLTDDVRLLAPVIPRSKIVCLGKNYEEHAKEVAARGPASEVPILFLKPNTAVIGPDDPIVMPRLQRGRAARGGARDRHRPRVPQRLPGERGGLHLRVYLRQRRHGARPAAP